MGFFERHNFAIQLARRLLDPLFSVAALYGTCLALGVAFNEPYQLLAIIASLLVVITFGTTNVYRPWRAAPLGQEAHYIWVSWLVVCGILFMLGYFTKTSEIFSRRVLLTWLVLTPVLMVGFHLSIRLVLRGLRERGRNFRTAVVVGGGTLGTKLVHQIEANPWLGLKVEGFFDDRHIARHVGHSPDAPYLGNIDQVAKYVREHRTQMVYLALPMKAEDRIRELTDVLTDETASVYLVPDIFAFQLMNARAQEIDGIPIIGLCESPFSGMEGWLKRFEDIVLGSVILALLTPLLLAIAIAIKTTSSGPIIFKQRRYGLDGRQIRVYKFRSMTVCEDGADIAQATQGDVRITRLGAFLRRTSLDELPQFYNVLQGRMSIVGPRPHAVVHNEQYRTLIKGYMWRHKVRPGITGLAQISGYRGQTETLDKMEKRVECDLNYIRNWSLFLDIKIIFLTVTRGFTHKNAF